MTHAIRNWCARCQFDGKEPFILGTAHVPAAAQHHEVEAAAYQMMDRLFPSRPVLLALLPGALVFHGDE